MAPTEKRINRATAARRPDTPTIMQRPVHGGPLLEGPHERLINAKKISAIILDLDNTLWDGTAAEKQELTLRKKLYAFLASAEKKGINLFIVSKNDPGNAEAAFTKLGVDRTLFTYVIANWDPKYLTVERVLEQTGIPPKRAIFLDDNPHERAEVAMRIPGTHCVDAAEWEILTEAGAIRDRREETRDSVEGRKNRYRTALEGGALKESMGENPEFLKRLGREIKMGRVSADKIGDGEGIDRFTRLFVETHRINFNPGKFGDYETALAYLCGRANEGDRLIAISTNELGVPLGLTGALVLHEEGDVARITDGTFSCGIIGRGFEAKAILALMERLKGEGMGKLEVALTLTATNRRTRDFLEEIGFAEEKREGGRALYSVGLGGLLPLEKYEWISLVPGEPEMRYTGHPAVISFFERHAKPLISRSKGAKVLNLGSARGEVIGHLQEGVRASFYRFVESHGAEYVKIDLEAVPGEGNTVADAEDLGSAVETGSQDLVMCLELLEHTRHFWKVIGEAARTCKVGGHILITVPSFGYPKHEYPIDQWRIGPETLASFFPKPQFEIIAEETESIGDSAPPRRSMILAKKLKDSDAIYAKPENGSYDPKTGLTVFP